MIDFILIRHGETDFNRETKYYGITDVGLNENGKMQIQALRNKLTQEEISTVYSSDLKRCVETCEHLGFNIDIRFSDALREMNFGEWEGLTYKEIKTSHKEHLEKWEADWINYPIPQGESFADMSSRVLAMFESIRTEAKNKAADKPIVLVTHGGCIRAILAHYILGEMKDSWRFVIQNAAATRIGFHKDYAYLKSLNER